MELNVCPIWKQHMQRISQTTIRMLRWMCRKTEIDKIGNECIQEHLWVVSISDKIKRIVCDGIDMSKTGQHRQALKRSCSTQVDGPLKEKE